MRGRSLMVQEEKYSHVLNPDGSYIEPKDFMDQFSIHMHKNRMEAFQGMTPEEMQ